jgi:hypothetical protein
MLNSKVFDLTSISKSENIDSNSYINIKLKHNDIATNKLFSNLYEYASNPLFIKIMNSVDVEHRKHYNKYANNKNFKVITRKFSTYKGKTTDTLLMGNYMLTNLKMMIYDYNI